jgi:simple sugar transport system ATP-binding protein/ribose transport system ATP-binding protein
MSSVHVRVQNAGKTFGIVEALRDVTLDVPRGMVHALIGENGAGKSTLGKVIAGAAQLDKGELIVDDRRVRYRSPRHAQADGIAMITQEIALIPRRPVIENVFSGIEPVKYGFVQAKTIVARYEELADRVGFRLPPWREVGSLPLAQQQQVEVLRAVARNARLIVMDEPTAALGRGDANSFLSMVRGLRANGITVIYVSHFLREVLEVADFVTVMRDGEVVRTGPASRESRESLITAMLGRPAQLFYPARKSAPGPDIALSVRGLTRGTAVLNAGLDVRAGEIVGLAGLTGSGRTELTRLLFGADRPDSGDIFVGPDLVAIHSPRDAIRLGIVMVPEDRKTAGLHLDRPIFENITMAHVRDMAHAGLISRSAERYQANEACERLEVRMRSLDAPVRDLSGGNQQKVLFAKWLLRVPRVLIANEPTRGIDVGARQAIYTILLSLAAQGVAIIMVSSDIEELMHISHRILIMRLGRIVAELDSQTATEEAIMAIALGTAENSPPDGNLLHGYEVCQRSAARPYYCSRRRDRPSKNGPLASIAARYP